MGTISVSENNISLSGAVDFNTVTVLEVKGITVIEHSTGKKLTVDLSGITTGDSAALAMMLSWRRKADRLQIQIIFEGWSPELLRLAKLCDIDRVLKY